MHCRCMSLRDLLQEKGPFVAKITFLIKEGGRAFYLIIFSSLILFRIVCGDIFGDFFNKRLHCVISAQ